MNWTELSGGVYFQNYRISVRLSSVHFCRDNVNTGLMETITQATTAEGKHTCNYRGTGGDRLPTFGLGTIKLLVSY